MKLLLALFFFYMLTALIFSFSLARAAGKPLPKPNAAELSKWLRFHRTIK